MLQVIMSFGIWLREHRKKKGLTLQQVAERSGVSFSYVSTLERKQPHSTTGKEVKPTRDKVLSLAKAVGGDVDDALLAAGYAPKTLTRKPETIPELVEALAQLGIEAPQPFGGYPNDPDGEGYREVVERIWLDIQMVTNRLTKGRNRPTIQNLEITEFDIDEEINKRKTS